MPVAIKKDGRREPYLRQKIMDGVQKACQKRSVPIQKIDELVNQVERRIQSYGIKEVPSKTVGQMVMIELHQLDKVAYIRFASVYREFKDAVEEFLSELKEMPASSPAEDPAALTFPFVQAPMPKTPEKGPAPVKARHRAREVALQILYRYDVALHSSQVPIPQGAELARDLARHFDHFQVAPPLREFAALLVAGTLSGMPGLDGLLETHASNWKVTRMGYVDRSLLRMAVYELRNVPETPRRS